MMFFQNCKLLVRILQGAFCKKLFPPFRSLNAVQKDPSISACSLPGSQAIYRVGPCRANDLQTRYNKNTKEGYENT